MKQLYFDISACNVPCAAHRAYQNGTRFTDSIWQRLSDRAISISGRSALDHFGFPESDLLGHQSRKRRSAFPWAEVIDFLRTAPEATINRKIMKAGLAIFFVGMLATSPTSPRRACQRLEKIRRSTPLDPYFFHGQHRPRRNFYVGGEMPESGGQGSDAQTDVRRSDGAKAD